MVNEFERRFARHRDELEWLHVGQTEDGITLNRYFISHPDMMMGTMGYSKHRMYGREGQTALFPAENWEEKLAEAVRSIHGQYVPALPSPDVLEKSLEIPMDGIRMYGYTVRNGKLYLREPDGFIEREKINAAQLVRAEGLIRIRAAGGSQICQKAAAVDSLFLPEKGKKDSFMEIFHIASQGRDGQHGLPCQAAVYPGGIGQRMGFAGNPGDREIWIFL